MPFSQEAWHSPGVTAGELLQASLLVEVWHQVPRKDSVVPKERRGCGNKVIGRRLGPSFQDVLLGVAHVPLCGLFTHTGKPWRPKSFV